MHPESQRIIGQILAPAGGQSAAIPTPASAPMSFEQIINPGGPYSGPERRAQGAIIAEPIAPPSPAAEVPAEER